MAYKYYLTGMKPISLAIGSQHSISLSRHHTSKMRTRIAIALIQFGNLQVRQAVCRLCLKTINSYFAILSTRVRHCSKGIRGHHPSQNNFHYQGLAHSFFSQSSCMPSIPL